MPSNKRELYYTSRHRAKVERAYRENKASVRGLEHSNNESLADAALRQGQFTEAKALLGRIRGHRQTKTLLKLASLPFYEIHFAQRNNKPVTDRLISAAECANTDIIDIIRFGRQSYLEQRNEAHPHLETKRMKYLRGDIGECVVAALVSRRYNEDGGAYMLPATRADGISRNGINGRHYSIDGYIVHTDNNEPGPRSIQIKSSCHYLTSRDYSPSIQMINIAELPGGNRPFFADTHLSRMLIDDHDATISDYAARQVDQADDILARMLRPTLRTGTAY